MNWSSILLWFISVAVVLWFGRRLPVTGMRKQAVIAVRLAAVTLLCLALSGWARQQVLQRPQHVIYLVDRSLSMDAHQREWVSRRIAALEAIRPEGLPRAVVVFGASAEVVEPFGEAPLIDTQALTAQLEVPSLDSSATNLEAALLETARLLPAGQGGHVVLFSDGAQTEGDAAQLQPHIRRLGISVYPVSVPVFGKTATVWESLTAPAVVQKGAPVPIHLVLYSGTEGAQKGVLTVSLGGIPIKRVAVRIRSGWQVLTTSVPAIQQGTLALEVHLAIPGEGVEERRMVYTEVEGPPHIVIVDDEPTQLPALAQALKRRGIGLSIIRPHELPTHVAGFLDYDAVLLFNIPKSALSQAQTDALQEYLSSLGGGLIMVGLGGDLASEVTTQAPLDALLPVVYEPKGLQESQRRVTIIMLIDRSASMLGPRIAATKRAAIELVKNLEPEDLVGMLAFDTKPYIVVEVQPAGWVGPELIEKLVRLRSTGGTDIYPALKAAQSRLNQTDSKLKHIILLSDGNTPKHAQEYEVLLSELKEEKISVSTIGIGSAFVNTKYLKWLADETGGSYYQLRSLKELPQLIARDTEDVLGRLPYTEGRFQPMRHPQSEWFQDVRYWPALNGYITATAKEGAQVDVIMPNPRPNLTERAGAKGDPLLVRWSLGRGRVVVFTSDADTRWTPDWVRWEGYEGWWAQVARWAMRRRASEEIFVWVDERGSIPRLILEGKLEHPRGRLVSPDGETDVALSLARTGTWRWDASLEQLPSGWYELVLETGRASDAEGLEPLVLADDSGNIQFARRWIQVGTPLVNEELEGQLPRQDLLQQLARGTGGFMNAPDLAFFPPMTEAKTRQPLLPWFLPPMIALLLLDIALRGSSML